MGFERVRVGLYADLCPGCIGLMRSVVCRSACSGSFPASLRIGVNDASGIWKKVLSMNRFGDKYKLLSRARREFGERVKGFNVPVKLRVWLVMTRAAVNLSAIISSVMRAVLITRNCWVYVVSETLGEK